MNLIDLMSDVIARYLSYDVYYNICIDIDIEKSRCEFFKSSSYTVAPSEDLVESQKNYEMK